MDGDVQRVQNVMYGAGSYHQAGEHGATDDTAQGVPGAFVEPVQEVVKSVLYHVRRGAVIEPEMIQRFLIFLGNIDLIFRSSCDIFLSF